MPLPSFPAMLPFLVILFALACVTAVVVIAAIKRKGGARGFLRAGPVHFGIEIDPAPPDERKPPP
jgi:hypothetical protein